tara:strand:+ start:408 stop:605 length:198 start_codon:yes stop_codon:yes gene_type:complete
MSRSTLALELAGDFLSTMDGQVIKRSFLDGDDIHIELLDGRMMVFTSISGHLVFGELAIRPEVVH